MPQWLNLKTGTLVIGALFALLAGIAYALIEIQRDIPASVTVQLRVPDGVEVYSNAELTQTADLLDFGVVELDVFGTPSGDTPVPLWVANLSNSNISLRVVDDFLIGEVLIGFGGAELRPSPEHAIVLEPGQVMDGQVALTFSEVVGGPHQFNVSFVAEGPIVPTPTPTPTPTRGPTPTPQLPDATLTIAHDASVQNLDIEFAAGGGDGAKEAARNLQSSLLRHARVPLSDGNSRMNVNEFEPLLAESWSFSADGSTITVNMRPGVLSERGNELTAADVRFFVDRSFHTQRVWAFIWRSLGVTDPEQVVVTDKYSLDFNLPTFNSVFMHAFTIFFTVQDSVTMLEHATVDDPFGIEWGEVNSAGFGPYKLSELKVGELTEFEPNPFFYRGRPQVVRAIQLTVPEPSVRASLLEAGTVDIAWGLTADQLASLVGKPGVKVLVEPNNLVGQENVMVLNNGRPPFDDTRVRKAIAHAIPYDVLTRGVFRGNATKQNFLLRPIDFGAFPANREFYGQDTPRAADLLAQAGYGLGNPLSFTVLVSDQSPDTGLGSLVAIQTALSDIGVNMDIDIITQANLGGQRFQRPLPYDALWDDSNRALIPNGLYTYTHFYQPTGISCCNFADYNNADIVTLLQSAVQAQDPDEQRARIQEIQEIIMADLPIVPVVYGLHRVAVRENISGIVWEANAWAHWADIVKR